MRPASSTLHVYGSTVPIVTENRPIPNSWCYTKKKIVKFNYMWTIDNFRWSLEEIGQGLESSTFSFSWDENELVWCLQMNEKRNINYKSYISMSLLLVSAEQELKVPARVKFSIINDTGIETQIVDSKSLNFRQGTKSEFTEFIEKSYLLDDANGLLPKNELTIYCEISIIEDSINITGDNKGLSFKVPDCKILDDLNALFQDKKITDVVLSVGDREFKAHKAILAARSVVFAAMFEHKMAESRNNRIEITDVEPDVLEEMLRFIYTGKANNIENLAADLLVVADKYALDRLKVMCEQELCLGITVENVAETLMLADFYSAGHLKSCAIEFFDMHATEVMDTEGFKAFRALTMQKVPPRKDQNSFP